MKDLILITSYCNNKQKENILRKLVSSINNNLFDIMLISHSVIPSDISEKCNISIYDNKNEILSDWDMRSTPWFNPNNERPILSCFTGFFNIHLAIWRMLIIGNSIAKNCGYKKVHHIEYDCIINNFDEFFDNSKLLDKYDAIIYNKTESTVDPILFGTFQSYNLEKLPEHLIKLDEEKIKHNIRNSSHKSTEHMLFDLLNHNNNVFIKNKTVLDEKNNKFGLSHTELSNQNTAWCLPYYDKLTHKLGFVIWNMEEPERNIIVKLIYNNKEIIDFGEIKPKHWVLRDIDDFSNSKSLLVLLNNKVRNNFEFDECRENFKKVSYRQDFNI